MKNTRLAVLGATGILLGAWAAGAWAQNTPPLKVYAAGEITPDRYTVVRRIWVDSLRSVIEIPRYSQSGEAIGAIVGAATRAGADGLVNLYCLNDRAASAENDAFLCYALAIKVR